VPSQAGVQLQFGLVWFDQSNGIAVKANKTPLGKR
jgi:hypothetical protein